MNPLNHFKTAKSFRNILLSLGVIFRLAITAHAQNLYVAAHVLGGNHKLRQGTPPSERQPLFPRTDASL